VRSTIEVLNAKVIPGTAIQLEITKKKLKTLQYILQWGGATIYSIQLSVQYKIASETNIIHNVYTYIGN